MNYKLNLSLFKILSQIINLSLFKTKYQTKLIVFKIFIK